MKNLLLAMTAATGLTMTAHADITIDIPPNAVQAVGSAHITLTENERQLFDKACPIIVQECLKHPSMTKKQIMLLCYAGAARIFPQGPKLNLDRKSVV